MSAVVAMRDPRPMVRAPERRARARWIAHEKALRIGTTPASVSRVCNGMAPGPALARRIVDATGGEVTFNDIYGAAEPVAPSPGEAA